jgi:hypothetical protein
MIVVEPRGGQDMDSSPRHDDPSPTPARPGPGGPPRARRSAIVGTVAGLVAIGSVGGLLAGLEPSAPPVGSTAAPGHVPGDHHARDVVDGTVPGLPASSTSATAAGGRSRSDVVIPGAAPFPRTTSPITAIFT